MPFELDRLSVCGKGGVPLVLHGTESSNLPNLFNIPGEECVSRTIPPVEILQRAVHRFDCGTCRREGFVDPHRRTYAQDIQREDGQKPKKPGAPAMPCVKGLCARIDLLDGPLVHAQILVRRWGLGEGFWANLGVGLGIQKKSRNAGTFCGIIHLTITKP